MGTRRSHKKLTKGGRALRAYLDQNALSVPVFCERSRIDRFRVQKAMTGEIEKVSVDLAYQIERATSGAVPMTAWRENKVKESPKASAAA